ncbi:MAG: hypothetical protein GEU80_15425 [Dehalococcoidia bacterium]|nr:hypothetical protein [Dehalococcoidia bacterium]
MPSNPRSRRRTERARRLPPRPTYRGAPVATVEAEDVPRVSRSSAGQAARRVEHDSPYLINELKRVAAVTAACFGLLGVLVIVERLQ